ncbi:MAG: aminopeptidase P family protein [Thermoanaerobaculia bacterium]|nr:aminopeptidase P family protein [Thermoanaerobaculia bacterium]
MFPASTYSDRRRRLAESLGEGIALFPGHDQAPMNYKDNYYPFHQDRSFHYYFGHSLPGLTGWLDLESGKARLYGYDPTLDDIVWTGPQPSLAELAEAIGAEPRDAQELTGDETGSSRVHYLPPYRGDTVLRLADQLGLTPEEVKSGASARLIAAVVAQRSIKDAAELEELERAVEISWAMHTTAMKVTRAGRSEQEVLADVLHEMNRRGGQTSFAVILSVRGETLHNHHHGNIIEDGQLLLHDSGAVAPSGYVSDITRTFPVSGRFDGRQRAVYETVLAAQQAALSVIAPGVPYADVHRVAGRTLAEGLVALGILRGNADEAEAAGAHALFMPHGLGHMMGLDVHDMEALGEDRVGYDEEFQRSDQFGRRSLRLGRRLQPGFVLTVEPGLYFVPDLIAGWRAESRMSEYIDYDVAESFLGFGGVRIEDDVVVTESGCRVLGPAIPKTIDEVEALMGDR